MLYSLLWVIQDLCHQQEVVSGRDREFGLQDLQSTYGACFGPFF